MSSFSFDKVLSDKDFNKAFIIYKEYKGTGTLNKRLQEEIINPKIEEINKITGQKNLSKYMAYALEYVLMQGDK